MKKLIFYLMLVIPGWMSGQVTESRSVSISVTVPEVAIIDLAPNTSTIELNLNAPRQAGDPVNMSDASDDSKWINYSSSVASGNIRRNISAQILSGSIPEGLELRLKVGKYQGNGKGKRGKPKNEIVLNAFPQIIVSNIGGAYTGRGIYQGHQVFFNLQYKNYSEIEFGTSTVVIAFTLTDN